METKQQKEAAFHDAAFSGGLRHDASKFYLIMDSCHGFYRNHLRTQSPGARVLEIGCGQDTNSFYMVRQGAREVTGIDISSVAIAEAKERAAGEGVNGVNFCVMDAEALDFPDNSFDLVCGVAILHHLDLAKSVGEIARILKPTGTAVFLEPLAHNPLINLYRRLTPHLRTEDEHPLTMADLRGFEQLFERVDTQFFHLLSLSMAPCYWLPGHEKLVRIMDTSDRVLFRMAPFLRRYAWTAGLIFSKPRRAGAAAHNGVAGVTGRPNS